MKQHKSLVGALALLLVWYSLTGSIRDPNNPPISRTGAPGETTCAASGCHNGGSFTGTVTISGVPDTVVANQTYTVTLLHSSNAVRAGFQLTCLDNNNAKCGTLTNGTGTSIANNNLLVRQYIRQSTPKNLNNGSTSWTFNWKAPATAGGNLAKFYFTSLAANGNGNNNGDNVLIGTKTVVFPDNSVATDEPDSKQWMQLYPTLVRDNEIQVRLLENNTGTLEIFDQDGRMVLQTVLSEANTIPVAHLPKGLYVARVTAEKRQVMQKFIIP